MNPRLASSSSLAPPPEPAVVMTSRCAQCHEPLPPPAPRAAWLDRRALCADCSLDGLPHTD
jgi:formylmethanofuran dehydrogenase subunit E